MHKYKQTIYDYLYISLGSIIFAFGLSLFAEPFQIAPGGIAGIAIIINYFNDWPIGMMSIIMNIPLFIIGFIKLGPAFLISSLYAMLVSSLAIDLTANYIPTFVEEPLLAAIYGGLVMGFGLGLVFRRGATTGGVDIIIRLLRIRFRNLKLGRLMLIMDMVVIAMAAIAFRDLNNALYAIITVYILSIVMDYIIYGGNFAKVAYIISIDGKYEQIAAEIQQELQRGVTFLDGQGAYNRQDTKIIMSAVNRTQIIRLHKIVENIDDKAFIIVTDAHEVFGDGFRSYGNQEL